jgi:hypothetical protein
MLTFSANSKRGPGRVPRHLELVLFGCAVSEVAAMTRQSISTHTPAKVITHLIPYPVFSSKSTGSVDLIEILLASHRATLHDFMALSYGPARALAYDRRRGFRAWVGCDDR